MPQLPTRVSVFAKFVLFTVVVGALAIAPSIDVQAQKNKPPTHRIATVTLADRPGDGLTSVGSTEYAGAEIGITGGDLRLELGTTGRAMQVTLGTRGVIGDGVTDPPLAGTTYVTTMVLTIANVGNIPVGSTQTSVGRIGLDNAFPNHALGFRATTINGVPIYGTEVCVSHDSPNVWTVRSSCGELSDTAGLFEENLKGKVGVRFKANYVVPFAFTVTCTLNCLQ